MKEIDLIKQTIFFSVAGRYYLKFEIMKNIERRLVKLLIAKGIDQKRISKDSDYYFDLNLDMLDLMSFAGSIKNEFSVNIPEDEIYRMEKISDTIGYLEKKDVIYSNFL